MRKKEDKPSFGVTDGLDFGNNTEEIIKEVIVQPVAAPEKRPPAKNTEVDPHRSYSIYYTPKPKKGAKGGTLGRGIVAESERKVQFSLTCTPVQKERFMKAAQNDHRKLSDFICLAVEEYIEKHGL